MRLCAADIRATYPCSLDLFDISPDNLAGRSDVFLCFLFFFFWLAHCRRRRRCLEGKVRYALYEKSGIGIREKLCIIEGCKSTIIASRVGRPHLCAQGSILHGYIDRCILRYTNKNGHVVCKIPFK